MNTVNTNTVPTASRRSLLLAFALTLLALTLLALLRLPL